MGAAIVFTALAVAVMRAIAVHPFGVAIAHIMAHGPMPFAAGLTFLGTAVAAHHRLRVFAVHLMALHLVIVVRGSGDGDRQSDRSG